MGRQLEGSLFLESLGNYSRTSRYGHRSNTDPSPIRTPLYYGQFPMSQQNSHIFSFHNTDSLTQTTDTKSRPQRVNSYKLNFFITDTAVIRWICTGWIPSGWWAMPGNNKSLVAVYQTTICERYTEEYNQPTKGNRLSKRKRNVLRCDDYFYFHHYSFQICITDQA